jgi:hypothetical protein
MSEGSIKIGASASQVVAIVGDHNTAVLTIAPTELPSPDDVDIRKELADLREQLGRIAAGDRALVDAAVAEADALAAKPQVAKDQVGAALERAIRYAGSAEKLATHGEKLWPTLKAIGGWLGEYGPKVLRVAGIAIL